MALTIVINAVFLSFRLICMETNKSIISLAAALMTFTAVASSLNEDRTPIHRPLIEEYTGTWCGWCVRGIVGMELLRETYGDDFIGVAYHNDDGMEIMYSNRYPNDIMGFPSAFIERTSEVDPLYGYSNTTPRQSSSCSLDPQCLLAECVRHQRGVSSHPYHAQSQWA